LIGIGFVLVVTEVLLRWFVVPIDEGWPHRVDLVYRAEGGDVVLGDSHMFRGFVTQDEFVNLAGGGSSARALEIVAREYFRHREPGRVIVAASPQLFNPSREAAGTQQHDEYFTQNFGLPFQLYVFERGIARRVSWLLDPAGLLDRARQAERRKVPGNPIDAMLAREMAGMNEAGRRKLAQGIVAKNRPVENLRDVEGFAAYRRMLESLAEQGARLCLVRTAVIAAVEEITREAPRFVDAHRVLRDLADELSLPYVDYRELGATFGDELFIDPDHLTATGGELFSRSVVRACFGPA
jgi:lysophospholipase L1-like esterase